MKHKQNEIGTRRVWYTHVQLTIIVERRETVINVKLCKKKKKNINPLFIKYVESI